MKKILFVAVAFVAMCFASCGGCTNGSNNVSDSDTVVLLDTVDTLACDTQVCLD